MSAAALRNINCAENKIQDDIDQRLFLKPTGPKKTRTRGPIILDGLNWQKIKDQLKPHRITRTTSVDQYWSKVCGVIYEISRYFSNI